MRVKRNVSLSQAKRGDFRSTDGQDVKEAQILANFRSLNLNISSAISMNNSTNIME